MSRVIEKSIVTNFDAFTAEHGLEAKAERELLIGGVALAKDIDLVGYQLRSANRSDLIPHFSAEIMPIAHPEEMHPSGQGNNFLGKFKMTGHNGQPLTASELGQLPNIPKISSARDFFDLIDNEDYPTVDGYNHSHKPVFLRMINIFPRLTGRLVMDVSHADDYVTPRNLVRAFVAYNLAAELVGGTDPDVVVKGIQNPEYLVS